MGIFILGVLIGWLAEWMFYTFWVKEGNNSGDCSNLEAELSAKDRQIKSLQAQLGALNEPTKVKAIQDDVKTATHTSNTATKQKRASAEKKSAVTASKSKSKTSTKKASNTKTTAKKAKVKGDDFTKLSGIGPSMSATLKSLGIDTFSKLAETDDDILRDMLEESGARMNNNKDVMDSWNEQAQVAAKGDFAELKRMQEALKK